jgi:hypothetical protein
MVIVEVRKQLLAHERELSERESTLLAEEHGVVEGERAHWWACMECDAIHLLRGLSASATHLHRHSVALSGV